MAGPCSDAEINQATHASAPTNQVLDGQSILRTSSGELWVPPSASEFQQRLRVIAHAGRSGHRGEVVALKTSKQFFFWPKKDRHVGAFVRLGLHCLRTGGVVPPRPFQESVGATRLNEVFRFDFLSMPEARRGYKYILVLKDRFSVFVELVMCNACTAEETFHGIVDVFKLCGVVPTWVTDQGAHFTSTLINRLQKALNVHHHLTLAYCPW